MSRQRGNSWEYTIKSKLLPKGKVTMTFRDEAEGDRAEARLKALLKKGIVPPELCAQAGGIVTMGAAIREYFKVVAVPTNDEKLLNPFLTRYDSLPLGEVTYAWVEKIVTSMKQEDKKAPSTIRHYVGALDRCLGWLVRRGTMPENPVKNLPRRYASYSAHDVKVAGVERVDEARERRLREGEEKLIRDEIAKRRVGAKSGTRDDWELLFTLALESAMRMFEMCSLSVDQLDFKATTIFLDKTKNGSKRQVPMTTVTVAALKKHIKAHAADIEQRGGRLFPWWDGEQTYRSHRYCTADVSRGFNRLVTKAGVAGLHFHDLRHEATSRLFERTKLNELQIAKITGHKSMAMLMRYANLRGSNLAQHLW